MSSNVDLPPIQSYRIPLPSAEPPSPEELARRHQIIKRIRRLRSEMKPLGVTVSDLLHQVREVDAL